LTAAAAASHPRVSVLIVNWNGLAHLETCLDSLKAQIFRDFEVILVDNGSTDGSLEFLRERYPWVRLVPLSENTGFATGNNKGLEQAGGEYIVALNNDTEAEPDWLETLVRVADAHPAAGMVGSRICSFDDHDLIDSVGHGVCRDAMSRGRFRNRRWSELRMQPVEEILFPSACVALYRRRMLEETGFFDDDFFAYAEDTDLGLRCRLAGWQAVAATDAVVYHKYSRTGGVFSPFKLYLVERNHYWLAFKLLPWRLLLLLPFFTALRYVEQARSVLSGSGSGGEFLSSGSRREIILAILKGTRDGLAGLPRMLHKRRAVMKTRKISMGEMSRLLRRYRLSFKELLDRG
jgi:GT2 family glycosyltransferase